jgi:hypothetical protein
MIGPLRTLIASRPRRPFRSPVWRPRTFRDPEGHGGLPSRSACPPIPRSHAACWTMTSPTAYAVGIPRSVITTGNGLPVLLPQGKHRCRLDRHPPSSRRDHSPYDYCVRTMCSWPPMKREDDTEHGKRFVATMLARQGASQQELWEGYRCNLTHSLGINAPEPERGVARSTQPRLRPTKIVRADAGGLRPGNRRTGLF